MFTRDHIHHAYIIEGEKEPVLIELFGLIKKELGIERQGNPDFFHEEFDVFGIDDGRRVKEMQANAAFTGTLKIFVLAMRSITHEAQNSLLKVFEEPAPHTHFFIIIPNTGKLLRTFISRASVVRHGSSSDGDEKFSPELFVISSPAKRLLMIKDIVEEKDKEKALRFLMSLARHMKKNGKGLMEKKDNEALRNISAALLDVQDRSSSVKLLLEHIALTL